MICDVKNPILNTFKARFDDKLIDDLIITAIIQLKKEYKFDNTKVFLGVIPY